MHAGSLSPERVARARERQITFDGVYRASDQTTVTRSVYTVHIIRHAIAAARCPGAALAERRERRSSSRGWSLRGGRGRFGGLVDGFLGGGSVVFGGMGFEDGEGVERDFWYF